MSDVRIKAPKPVINTATNRDGYPDAIMDDTVYTMDDARVLMGGPTTSIGIQPVGIDRGTKPRIKK